LLLRIKLPFPSGTLHFDEHYVFAVRRDRVFTLFVIVAGRFPLDDPIIQGLEIETDSKLVQSLVSLRRLLKSRHEAVNPSLLLSK
jgi:hypothetical protein